MGWRGRGRGGGMSGPWPGRGPFSYLPPWQRPGWVYGRGACWWLAPPYTGATGLDSTTMTPPAPTSPYFPTYTREQESQMLERQMAYLQSQLAAIKQRIEELKE